MTTRWVVILEGGEHRQFGNTQDMVDYATNNQYVEEIRRLHTGE